MSFALNICALCCALGAWNYENARYHQRNASFQLACFVFALISTLYVIACTIH